MVQVWIWCAMQWADYPASHLIKMIIIILNLLQEGDPLFGVPAWKIGPHLIATEKSVLLFGGDPM